MQGKLMNYTEGEIRLAALIALNASVTGTLSTTELIAALAFFMHPRDHDALTAQGRADTYFSQKVRNLISHRDCLTSLTSKGLVAYDADNENLTITDTGRAVCSL
jgi:hypothetical protein